MKWIWLLDRSNQPQSGGTIITIGNKDGEIRRMARVAFTENIQRHVECPPIEDLPGDTVREVLEAAFAQNPRARTYVLDDQGILRKHMQVFVNGEPVSDRMGLSDPIGVDGEVYVMQALSGG